MPSGQPVNQTSTLTTGSWKPQVHFIWDVILDTYFKNVASSGLKDKASFQEFYRVTIDGESKQDRHIICLGTDLALTETLFAPASSPQRKYWGFEIISKALPLLSESVLPLIFTQNFMKCWMNHLSGEDRYLHKAAQRIVSQS
jgi:DNA polymerase phi